LKTSARMFAIALVSGLLVSLSSVRVQAQSVSSGTVPFVLDGNRVYAQVEFITREGKARKALVFVGRLIEINARVTAF
jgi:hypothetical protein